MVTSTTHALIRQTALTMAVYREEVNKSHVISLISSHWGSFAADVGNWRRRLEIRSELVISENINSNGVKFLSSLVRLQTALSKNEYLVFAPREETAVYAVVGSIVWAFRRLKKSRNREMSARRFTAFALNFPSFLYILMAASHDLA